VRSGDNSAEMEQVTLGEGVLEHVAALKRKILIYFGWHYGAFWSQLQFQLYFMLGR
jgi:hypothetical protein